MNVVATLVSVSDVPVAATSMANFKVEGVVNSTGTNSISVGGLSINLATATCRVAGVVRPCANAFSVGQVVSSMAPTAPGLPATSLTATFARLGNNVALNTSSTAVEVEGAVSTVNLAGSSFVVRGVSVDASALPGSALPAVGDVVRVVGSLSGTGQSVLASSVDVVNAAASASLTLLGDASSVVAGANTGAFVVTVLGENVNVTATTRLMDHSVNAWWRIDPTTNPFNISSFQTYLAASASQHLSISAVADATGHLNAVAITIVPPSSTSSVTGLIDSSPAPTVSTVSGTPSHFSIHGLNISADPAAIFNARHNSLQPVAAGDEVSATGTYAAGLLTVTATPANANYVLDLGPPTVRNRGAF